MGWKWQLMDGIQSGMTRVMHPLSLGRMVSVGAAGAGAGAGAANAKE